jgi:hypothetical protein
MERDPKERIAELLKANNEYLDGWRKEKAKTARFRDALRAALNDNVWYAYYAGVVRDDLWFDAGMSDAEWLERELGLSLHVRHRVEDVIRRFAELVERRVKQAEAGK